MAVRRCRVLQAVSPGLSLWLCLRKILTFLLDTFWRPGRLRAGSELPACETLRARPPGGASTVKERQRWSAAEREHLDGAQRAVQSPGVASRAPHDRCSRIIRPEVTQRHHTRVQLLHRKSAGQQKNTLWTATGMIAVNARNSARTLIGKQLACRRDITTTKESPLTCRCVGRQSAPLRDPPEY